MCTDLQKSEVIAGRDCECVCESVGASYKVDPSNNRRRRCCRNFSGFQLGREKRQKDLLARSLSGKKRTQSTRVGRLSKNVEFVLEFIEEKSIS